MDKLYGMDKRIMGLLLILSMIMLLIFFFVINSREEESVSVGYDASISETDNGVSVTLEEDLSEEERNKLEQDIEKLTGEPTNVEPAQPYDSNDQEYLDGLQDRLKGNEDLGADDFKTYSDGTE